MMDFVARPEPTVTLPPGYVVGKKKAAGSGKRGDEEPLRNKLVRLRRADNAGADRAVKMSIEGKGLAS